MRACCGDKDESATQQGTAGGGGGGTWGIPQQTVVTEPGDLLLENDIKTEKTRVWV